MNRNQKIDLLKDALEGNGGQVRQIQQQRKKDSMPIRKLYGVVNIRSCPASMLDIQVIPTEDLIDGDRTNWMPLRECLRQFEETGWSLPLYQYRADGCIDANDPCFDEVMLEYIGIHSRNKGWTQLPHQTIADLRRYYKMSADSLDKVFIVLWFDCVPEIRGQATHKNNVLTT